MKIIEKIKKYNYTEALIGILAIVTYFILTSVESLPFEIVGVNLTTLPNWVKILYLLIYEILSMGIVAIIFRKKLIHDFKDICKHHKEYYSKYFKYWLIGIMIMLISNSIIMFLFKHSMAGNEEAVRSLFKISPIYIYLSSVLYAPFVEELIFRQAFKNIFRKTWLFIFLSGFIFGGLHVFTNIETALDLLYLIPYCSLGFAFAYMLYKTNNIFVSMGFHFLHNGLLISLQFLVLLFS